MKKVLLTAAGILFATFNLQAAFTMSPLTTFGWNGDGWFAPGEGGYAYLTTGNTERGLAYNPITGHLYLVSRANVGGDALHIRILDPLTGADLGALNDSGISGGTFAVDMVAVGGDGAIYVGNLTVQATTSPFKVYKWTTEASTPTVAYSGTPIANGRVGDTLDAIGSGSSTLLVAGFNQSPSVPGNNGYAIIDPTTGTHTQVTFPGTPPNAGDFTLGITFSDASHVFGTRGGLSPAAIRYSTYSGSTGTLLGSPPVTSNAERPMDFVVLGGIPLLATQSTGDSAVRVYDMTDPLNPVPVLYGRNVVDPISSNVNGTGSVAWGDLAYDSVNEVWTAKLWAMSSNQGIQAFIVTVPEPTSAVLAAVGGLLLAAWSARRRAR